MGKTGGEVYKDGSEGWLPFMTPWLRVFACSGVVLLVAEACAGRAPPAMNAPGAAARPIAPQAMDLQRNITDMLSFDANNDGIVTKEELEAGLQRQFAAADTNGDGRLDAAEMQAENDRRWRQSGTASSPLIDWNQDGVIDFAEFATTARTLFGQLDRDRGGTLAGVELRVPVARRAPPDPGQRRRGQS
jgi:Ca2+-binding EF-hand superfamily protein